MDGLRVVAGWVLTLLLVIGVGIGVDVGIGVASAGLIPSGTATIRVTFGPPGSPTRFSGTIDGAALSGSYSSTDPAVLARLCAGAPNMGEFGEPENQTFE